jgi:hypothetical protein|tara:strand:- start:179 stop:430 length:252 start_codon:yes stop_codon:yes gene_type:complete
MTKDRDFIDKVLNPTSIEDIYDTVPKAKELLQQALPRVAAKKMLPSSREQRLAERRDKLSKIAIDNSAKLLARRLAEIKKNTS